MDAADRQQRDQSQPGGSGGGGARGGTTHRLVRAVAARMAVARFLRALVVLLIVGAGAAGALAVIEKLTATAMPWAAVLIGWSGASVVSAAVWSWARRPGRIAVAQRVDERAGLRDAVGTALSLEDLEAGLAEAGRADAVDARWSGLVRADAERRAAGVSAGSVEPISPPRGVVTLSVLSLAAVLAWMFVPTMDLLGKQAAQREREQQQREIEETRREIERTQGELERAIQQLDESLGVESRAFDAELPESVRDAEELRRARVRQLTALSEKLDEAARGPGAKKAEELEEALRKLRRPGAGPLDEVATNLARSKLETTGEALEDLRQRLASGELSPAEQRELAEQARDLAEQLETLSEAGRASARERVERVLTEQGMPGERIDTVSEDEQTIEELMGQQTLSEQQRQSVENAQAERFASDQMEEMSEALRELGNQLKDAPEGDPMQIDRAMRDLAQSLAESQELREQMRQLAEAMQLTRQQLSQMGMRGREGNRANQSGESGPGGRQQAGGQQPGTEGDPGEGFSDREFALRQERSPVRDGEGPIIASTLVDGPQIRGESTARFADAVRAAEQAAGDAIESRAIPSDRRRIIANYFGSLRKPAAEGGGSGGSGSGGDADSGSGADSGTGSGSGGGSGDA